MVSGLSGQSIESLIGIVILTIDSIVPRFRNEVMKKAPKSPRKLRYEAAISINNQIGSSLRSNFGV